jgi:amino-acid N-acetyltransferase
MAESLFQRAFEAGAHELYLLTDSAGGFFEKLGFEWVDRSTAPEVIRSTRQFPGMCCSSAAFFHRTFAGYSFGSRPLRRSRSTS